MNKYWHMLSTQLTSMMIVLVSFLVEDFDTTPGESSPLSSRFSTEPNSVSVQDLQLLKEAYREARSSSDRTSNSSKLACLFGM